MAAETFVEETPDQKAQQAVQQVSEIVASELIWDTISLVIEKKLHAASSQSQQQQQLNALQTRKSADSLMALQQQQQQQQLSLQSGGMSKSQSLDRSALQRYEQQSTSQAQQNQAGQAVIIDSNNKAHGRAQSVADPTDLQRNMLKLQTQSAPSPNQQQSQSFKSPLKNLLAMGSTSNRSNDGGIELDNIGGDHYIGHHSNHNNSNIHHQKKQSQQGQGKKDKSFHHHHNHNHQDDDGVKVGEKVSEGHANFVLMYDMLTGIRIAVSRCVAKPHRDLTPADFLAKHKLTFDVLGNELTPSSKYDFKFKDYAPWVFRRIRELFKIEAADYLISLTGKYVLSELGSSGKSGSFFYFSQDYRFIIKTIHKTEHKFMRKILSQYYEHLQSNPNTLLSRYLGLHRVKLPQGRKIYFVVMCNVFPPNKDIHETFDLKGSMIGREVSAEKIKLNPRCVMKDINWLNMKKRLALGPEKKDLFVTQLQKDVTLLVSLNIMDYSLLTGIHYLKRGNSENIRDQFLSVFEPNAETLSRRPMSSNMKAANLSSLKLAIAQAEAVQGLSSSGFPDENPAERRGCVFYQDDGGFLSTDEQNRPLLELYYVGIIDILTPYNTSKAVEHYWKSLNHDKNLISAVNPIRYGHRFLEFMLTHVVNQK
ncbi:hypothetical protein MP228_010614 [Amoeboaphelidium protococcarum]|nr:hypothetical protein MP228_010614 [Amoeboaphelidium protococcarum]